MEKFEAVLGFFQVLFLGFKGFSVCEFQTASSFCIFSEQASALLCKHNAVSKARVNDLLDGTIQLFITLLEDLVTTNELNLYVYIYGRPCDSVCCGKKHFQF